MEFEGQLDLLKQSYPIARKNATAIANYQETYDKAVLTHSYLSNPGESGKSSMLSVPSRFPGTRDVDLDKKAATLIVKIEQEQLVTQEYSHFFGDGWDRMDAFFIESPLCKVIKLYITTARETCSLKEMEIDLVFYFKELLRLFCVFTTYVETDNHKANTQQKVMLTDETAQQWEKFIKYVEAVNRKANTQQEVMWTHEIAQQYGKLSEPMKQFLLKMITQLSTTLLERGFWEEMDELMETGLEEQIKVNCRGLEEEKEIEWVNTSWWNFLYDVDYVVYFKELLEGFSGSGMLTEIKTDNLKANAQQEAMYRDKEQALIGKVSQQTGILLEEKFSELLEQLLGLLHEIAQLPRKLQERQLSEQMKQLLKTTLKKKIQVDDRGISKFKKNPGRRISKNLQKYWNNNGRAQRRDEDKHVSIACLDTGNREGILSYIQSTIRDTERTLQVEIGDYRENESCEPHQCPLKSYDYVGPYMPIICKSQYGDETPSSGNHDSRPTTNIPASMKMIGRSCCRTSDSAKSEAKSLQGDSVRASSKQSTELFSGDLSPLFVSENMCEAKPEVSAPADAKHAENAATGDGEQTASGRHNIHGSTSVETGLSQQFVGHDSQDETYFSQQLDEQSNQGELTSRHLCEFESNKTQPEIVTSPLTTDAKHLENSAIVDEQRHVHSVVEQSKVLLTPEQRASNHHSLLGSSSVETGLSQQFAEHGNQDEATFEHSNQDEAQSKHLYEFENSEAQPEILTSPLTATDVKRLIGDDQRRTVEQNKVPLTPSQQPVQAIEVLPEQTTDSHYSIHGSSSVESVLSLHLIEHMHGNQDETNSIQLCESKNSEAQPEILTPVEKAELSTPSQQPRKAIEVLPGQTTSGHQNVPNTSSGATRWSQQLVEHTDDDESVANMMPLCESQITESQPEILTLPLTTVPKDFKTSAIVDDQRCVGGAVDQRELQTSMIGNKVEAEGGHGYYGSSHTVCVEKRENCVCNLSRPSTAAVLGGNDGQSSPQNVSSPATSTVPIFPVNHREEYTLGYEGQAGIAWLSDSDKLSPPNANANVDASDTHKEKSVPKEIVSLKFEDLKRFTNNFDLNPMVDGGHKIGAGSFGIVFHAYMPLGGSKAEEVAIKKFKQPKGIKDSQVKLNRRQFPTELMALTRWNHPNIVRLLGHCADGPELCLVYEYVKGGNLASLLAKGNANPLLWDIRLKVVRDIARALTYLHTSPHGSLLHRDVKSANVLVSEECEGKLADFGLAIAIEDEENPFESFVVTSAVGTKSYMAPEAFKGRVSPRTDVYAFGMVLYEVITGLPPYSTTKKKDLVAFMRELEGQLGDLSVMGDPRAKWPVELAGDLLKLARWCTDSNSKLRPSMTVVAEILEMLMRDNPGDSDQLY